ncbi:hypothetical protein RvY_11205-1 [Ramazzottius varieornatus]|uniref:Uncharacterized protein n=1 Tax=Ramazzottius varieornatus TaxID=947166 RepID=A0A1D1VFC7_RAMVA|nr:hypothetical protein RvY_11205-1 [Ramazzottius varieornatus]
MSGREYAHCAFQGHRRRVGSGQQRHLHPGGQLAQVVPHSANQLLLFGCRAEQQGSLRIFLTNGTIGCQSDQSHGRHGATLQLDLHFHRLRRIGLRHTGFQCSSAAFGRQENLHRRP